MNSSILYNFRNNVDDDISLKINMEELYEKKQQQAMNVLNNYNKILTRIHNKIKFTSKQLINEQCCWFIIPEILLGIPKYDVKDCTVYVIEKLRQNGFVVRYTHPNLIFISWRHFVPNYVRNEIKKSTGKNIDEYGNIVNNDEINNQTIDNNNLTLFNKKDNIELNKNNKIKDKDKDKDKDKNIYKDITSYKPSGGLIYNNNLLKKLDINS